MFGKNKTTGCPAKSEYQIREEVTTQLQHDFDLERQRTNLEHELTLKEKEFELKHFESEKVKELNDQKVDLEKKLAIATKEIEMLVKITDLNADIVDVKDLVKNLIEKLPEIKISNLSVTQHQDSPSKK